MESLSFIKQRPLTIALLCWIALAFAAPLSSTSYSELVYKYETNVVSGATGFKFKAQVHLEVLYSASASENDIAPSASSEPTATSRLVRLRLTEPTFFTAPADGSQPLPPIAGRYKDYDIYAHIVTQANGTAHIKSLYTHQADPTTFKNLKKSILFNLLAIDSHRDDDSQQGIFSPDLVSEIAIKKKSRKPQQVNNAIPTDQTIADIVILETVEGSQNVTFRSRVFSQAESNLTTNFQLALVNELESSAHELFDQADSVEGAIKLIDVESKYRADTPRLERERRVCSTHHCGKSLAQLYDDYRVHLTEDYTATVENAIAFLQLLDRLRNPKGTSVKEIIDVLERSSNDPGAEAALLNILASARTKSCITAALKYLNLPKNKDLDTSERILSVLSVAAKTTANMPLGGRLKTSKEARAQSTEMASLGFIADKLLAILEQTPGTRWKSQKLRWSTLLTLATTANANADGAINKRVSKLLMKELDSCDEADCRIVVFQAIGNLGQPDEQQLRVLREHALESEQRESVSAMKVLRDLLQANKQGGIAKEQFKDFLLRVVYDESRDTTARILAAESIVRFLPNSSASQELLLQLPSFGNNELATIIYHRMQSLMVDDANMPRHHENWYWKSSIINGTSTSFVRTMARTDSVKASYGVNVELPNKKKMPKEFSFDFFLDNDERTQDLFALDVQIRGMSAFAGGSDEDSAESNEATIAGMTLRVLGGYLRPYIMFTSQKQLVGSVLSGQASKPNTAFKGDLLLMDYDEGYPLISGFVSELRIRGALSIDVTGSASINAWYWTAHSLVRTKAAIIAQASQSVFTSLDDLWMSHLMAFGGDANVDIVGDATSSPPRLCLQVTQPQFSLRFNTRRHDQMMTNEVRRKITRTNFHIGAKSYPLNSENNKMCSSLDNEGYL